MTYLEPSAGMQSSPALGRFLRLVLFAQLLAALGMCVIVAVG